MLLFYINFGDRNPPYPALGSNIPSARRRGQRFHFLQCRGSSPSLRFVNRHGGTLRRAGWVAFTKTYSRGKWLISHLPPTFAIIIHIPRPLLPCIWHPRVPYLMSSSPSSRVPKSPSPHTRVPMSPSHFYTQPFCLMEVPFIPRLLSYWKSQLPQGLMGCICGLRRFLFSFVCFYFPCGGKKTQTRSTKYTFKVTFFIFLNKLNVWKRCSVLE